MRNDDPNYAATVHAPGWLIAEPLDPAIAQQVAEFNLRGLRQQLAPLAWGEARVPLAGETCLPAPRAGSVLHDLQAQWRSLDAPAMQRLAAMPFLLFELGLDTLPLFDRASTADASMNQAGAPLELASQLLGYAWHLARANPLGAALSLGMPAPCAAALRDLGFGELQACTGPAAACLRLRWSERPSVWRPLLAAARSDDREALAREQLAGLRRLAGELMHATAVGTPAGAAGRVAEPLW